MTVEHVKLGKTLQEEQELELPSESILPQI